MTAGRGESDGPAGLLGGPEPPERREEAIHVAVVALTQEAKAVLGKVVEDEEPGQCLPHRSPQLLFRHREVGGVEARQYRPHSGGVLLREHRAEPPGGEEGAEDSLGAIAGVRAELASGDHRALYLAWLSAIGAWALQEDDEEAYRAAVEPPVPAGLDRLTAPQRALADFLRVDADLLAVAAQASPPAPEPPKRPGKKALAPLIAALPDKEKNELLLRLALGSEAQLGAELLRRLRGEPVAATVPGQRSAAELLDAAHARAAGRRQRAERVRDEARAKKLIALAADEEAIWREVENHVARKQVARYDAAVALLVELRDACDHVGRGLEFRQRLAALREEHRHLPGLLRRLDDRALRG